MACRKGCRSSRSRCVMSMPRGRSRHCSCIGIGVMSANKAPASHRRIDAVHQDGDVLWEALIEWRGHDVEAPQENARVAARLRNHSHKTHDLTLCECVVPVLPSPQTSSGPSAQLRRRQGAMGTCARTWARGIDVDLPGGDERVVDHHVRVERHVRLHCRGSPRLHIAAARSSHGPSRRRRIRRHPCQRVEQGRPARVNGGLDLRAIEHVVAGVEQPFLCGERSGKRQQDAPNRTQNQSIITS